MIKMKKNKAMILSCLLILHSALILYSFLTPVSAIEYIPEESPNNDWYWDIKENDKLMFEVERTIKNGTNLEFINATKLLMIFNITSFQNVTFNSGFYTQNMSKVNADLCFWNATSGDLQKITSTNQFAVFGYNETDNIMPEKYYTQNHLFTPLLIPINGSNGLEIDVMLEIINNSLLDPFSQFGYFNKFNESSYTIANDNHQMILENKVLGYYFNLTFYNNGSLRFAHIKFHDLNSNRLIEQKLTRVFSMDDTDKVLWPKAIGEEYTYDTWGEGTSLKLKVKVSSITNHTEMIKFEGLNYYRNYQTILGDIYQWNGTDYQFDNADILLGDANNFYVANPNEISELYTLFPDYTSRSDLDFLFNDNTNHSFPDTFYGGKIFENSNDFIISLITVSGDDMVNITLDKGTKVVNDLIVYDNFGLEFYLTEPYTDIDWGLEPGDILYAKKNDEDGIENIKMEIFGWNMDFYNLTEIEISSGGLFISPQNQPELQFFSVLYAKVYENMDTPTFGLDPIGFANPNWPYFPITLMGGGSPSYPFVLPMGTTPQDLTCLSSFTDQLFGETTYTNNHIIFTNTTEQKSLKINLNNAGNLIKHSGGWILGDSGNWEYFSTYLKDFIEISTGTISMPSQFSVSATTEAMIESSGTNPFYYTIFKDNPINETIGNGTVLAYFDLFTNDTAGLTSFHLKTTFTTLNPTIDKIYFYYVDSSGSANFWVGATPSDLEEAILQKTTNSITFNLTHMIPSISQGMIFAVSYTRVGGGGGGIPGFPFYMTTFILLTVLSFIGISTYKKLRI